jgi:hypothetical protein
MDRGKSRQIHVGTLGAERLRSAVRRAVDRNVREDPDVSRRLCRVRTHSDQLDVDLQRLVRLLRSVIPGLWRYSSAQTNRSGSIVKTEQVGVLLSDRPNRRGQREE